MIFCEHHFVNFSSKLVISLNNVDRETKFGSTVYRVMKETIKIAGTEKKMENSLISDNNDTLSSVFLVFHYV